MGKIIGEIKYHLFLYYNPTYLRERYRSEAFKAPFTHSLNLESVIYLSYKRALYLFPTLIEPLAALEVVRWNIVMFV